MIHRFILSLLVALTLIAVGCGEEEKKSSSDTGSTSGGGDSSGSTSGTEDGTSGGGDSSGSTSGTEDASTSGTEDASTSGTEDVAGDTSGSTATTDLCQNTADLDYLAAILSSGQYSGSSGRDAAADAASACGLANISAEDPKAATIECMQGDPHNIALTDGCTGCYGDIVLCTIEKCIAKCAADPSSTGCTDCQEQQGCRAAFDDCTGDLP